MICKSRLSVVTMAEQAVRQSLEKFYSLHGELPAELVEQVSPKLARTQDRTSAGYNAQPQQRPDDKLIASIFKDPRISLEQREKISDAILNGRFEVVNAALEKLKIKPRTEQREDDKQRLAELTVQRHRLPKANFLEVVTHSANIPALSGNEVRSNRIAVQKQMGSPPHSGPQTRNEQRFNSGERVPPSQKMNIKERQNQLVAEHNRKRMERAKEEAKRKSEQVSQLKELEAASTLKKLEVKKKLQEVRKSLRAHLVNNRDPQLGAIMRCVDESLIYHFMEKYKGFAMSAQAILALVGNSLGTNLVNSEVTINPEDGEPPGTADTNFTSTSAAERHDRPSELNSTRKPHGRKQLAPLEFDDSRHNTPGSSVPHSPISRGRSRGLLDSAPTSGSIPQNNRSHSRGAISTNTREFISTETRQHPRSRGRTGGEKERTGMTDLVTGITPRRYRAERSPSPDTTAAWGGGFRAIPPRSDGSHSPNRPVEASLGRPASMPSMQRTGHSPSGRNTQSMSREFRPPRSAGFSGTQNSQSLVIFGSEHLRMSAESMGFAPEQQEMSVGHHGERHEEHDDNNSVFSHRSMLSTDSYHTSVPNNAIAAMHEQLIEENILPSMQPEPVLSAEQIRDLGLHKKTFNQIMKEIGKGGSYNSHASLETDPAMHTKHPQLSQYDTVGTVQITDSMPNSPREGSVHSALVGTLSSTSANVNPIVAHMMSSSAPKLFVEPLSATAEVPSPPKQFNTLYGSVYSAADKERFQHLAVMEIERGEQRFGLDTQQSPHHKLSLSRPYEGGSPGKVHLMELAKPPRAIKTREGRVDEENNPIPLAPYGSYAEESHVVNAGVPAGAGLMLWRPRYRVSREGRYRAGQSHTRLKHSLKEGPAKRPFVSAA